MKAYQNTKGNIYYGLHFYPGVAEYEEPGKEPYRVYLNEDTLRRMDPTFAGKPIFVEHVDEVDPDLNQLRTEADGWVIESFFNSSDGKHWVKFITVTDKADRAIRSGMRLSNAYIPKSFKEGGLWNGVTYSKEITSGEYEHLAIVKNPRYEESKILTPDEFKGYNDEKTKELKKLSNSQKGAKPMKFNFFKRTKVENAIDPDLQVVLPKSGKEVTISDLINEADSRRMKNEAGESAKEHAMANLDHMVKMHDGSYMKVKDVLSKHKSMMDDLEDMKKEKKDSKEEELDLKMEPSAVDAEGDLHNKDAPEEGDMDDHEEKVAEVEHKEELKDDLEHPEDVVHDDDKEEDEKAKKKALQLEEHEDKEIEAAKKDSKSKKKNELEKAKAKEKADRLRNAHLRVFENSQEPPTLELIVDQVERGKTRYGS